MNERIRELVEQAVKAVDNPFPGNPLNDELAKMYITDCFAEKFAELIVRECIRVPYDMWDKAELNADVAVKIEYRIKDHFGVEE